jgi:acetyl-CoA acyltransferase
MPEAEQGLNIARIAALRAGFPDSVPGVTVNRFCASGLQSVAMAAAAIQTGMVEIALAGGVESMSCVPMMGHLPLPNPYLVDHRPGVYLNMGLTAEKVARRYGVSREDQDRFALRSHRRASQAERDGRLRAGRVAVPVAASRAVDGRLQPPQTAVFDHEELIRHEASLEVMATLRPAFAQGGSVTAGNSSPLSDGAAALLLVEASRAKALGLRPLARFLGYLAVGVDPEYMGIGPVLAIPKLLSRLGLRQEDIALIELNEAFAAQSLAVIRELGLDEDRVNVNGGAIALGHPLGCTGAKLSSALIHELRRLGGGLGLVTMCVGGGMGAAGVFEVYPAEAA